MHPYLPSRDVVYNHPLVQPDCSSLEVCSVENQGRYLQRPARGNTITFELSVFRSLHVQGDRENVAN